MRQHDMGGEGGIPGEHKMRAAQCKRRLSLRSSQAAQSSYTSFLGNPGDGSPPRATPKKADRPADMPIRAQFRSGAPR